MTILRTTLRGTAALGVLAALSTQAIAQETTAAQTPAPVAEDESESDIIVTAQRRSERVQDIPLAITAFTGDQISRAGIVSLENVAPRIPSFYFGSFGAARPQLYIRGIGTRSFDPGSESSVGVFVDEVYLGRASGSFGSLRDIERIEVLRGPQGTLYGRNTIGGAINVITRGPTPQFEAEVEAGISNYNGYELFGAVGGPIVSDGSLMFRVSGWRTYREGYMTNLVTGNTFQGLDNWGGRARLAFRPSSNFRIDLTAEIIDDGNEAAFSGFNQGSGPSQNAITGVITPANPLATFLGQAARPPISNVGLRNDGYLSFEPFLDRQAQTYIARAEYDAAFATLTSVTSYRTLRIDDGRDLEGSSRDVINQLSRERSRQFTQEIRLTSNREGPASFDGALDWIIGGFYYRDRSNRRDTFNLGVDSVVAAIPLPGGGGPGGPQTSTALSDYDIDSYALFGQATLHLGSFDITLGARWTRDEKRAVQQGLNTRPGVPLVAVPFTVDNSAVYESFDPRLNVTFNITPDVNIYASYSTGFKSGGFQYVPFAASQANVLFAPEELTAYEIGFKSEWLNRTVRFNVAAFRYEYDNLQVSRIVDLGGGAAASLITNAAQSTIQGVEVEVMLRPTRNFDVSVAYGFLDAQYDNYVFNATQNFSGTRMVRAPRSSLNLGAEWRIPFGDDGRVTLRADYAYMSTFFHEPGEANPIFGGATSLTREPGYGLLDLRASVDYRNFRVSAYVTNVFDTSYRRTVLALGSTLSNFPGQPRIVGLRVGYRFQ